VRGLTPLEKLTCFGRAAELYGRHQFASDISADPLSRLGMGEAICFFTESLILAQDERWRRA
jgi:hypothetical protein